MLAYFENTTAKLLVIYGNIKTLKTTRGFSTCVLVMYVSMNSGHICGLH